MQYHNQALMKYHDEAWAHLQNVLKAPGLDDYPHWAQSNYEKPQWAPSNYEKLQRVLSHKEYHEEPYNSYKSCDIFNTILNNFEAKWTHYFNFLDIF